MIDIAPVKEPQASSNAKETEMVSHDSKPLRLPVPEIAVAANTEEDTFMGYPDMDMDIRVDIATQTEEGSDHTDRLIRENEEIRQAMSGVLARYDEMYSIRHTEAERNFENHKAICDKRYAVSEEARLELMRENQDLRDEVATLRQQLQRSGAAQVVDDTARSARNRQSDQDRANMKIMMMDRAREHAYLLDVYEKFTGLSLGVTDLGALRCVQKMKEGALPPLVFELTPCHDDEDDDPDSVAGSTSRRETMSKSRRETISEQSGFLLFEYEPVSVPSELPSYLSQSMIFSQDKTMQFYHRLIKEWL